MITDRIDQPLLPSGISELPVSLNGQLVYIFEAGDGTDTLHFIGDFTSTLGEHGGQTLRSREAV